MPSLREADIQRACLDLLAAHGIWFERRNTGAFGGEHNGKKRFVRFSRKGTADIMATPVEWVGPNTVSVDPYILWIECKTATGKQSPEQKSFEAEVLDAGHHYLLVRDVDELESWLRKHGCL